MTTSAGLDDATSSRVSESTYDELSESTYDELIGTFRYYYYTPILNVTIVVSIIAIIILIVVMSVYSKWSDMIWLNSFLGIFIYLLVAGLLYKGMWCSTQYDAASDDIIHKLARSLAPNNELMNKNAVIPGIISDAISNLELNVHEIQHFNKRWPNFKIAESKAVATDGYSIGYWFNI